MARSSQKPQPTMAKTIDRRSGQVYTESTIVPSLSSSKGPSWVHETPFLPRGWEETSQAGAPSLQHSAMKQLLSDQRNLQPALFVDVPWRIASYLWDCLGRSRKRTLHSWKLFATAYPEQFRAVSSYRSMKIEGPRMSMQEYLGLVKSDSLSWRAVLTLASSFARVPELVEISSIRNLVALEIATPSHTAPVLDDTEPPLATLSDRIVRTWSELAQDAGAFAHLRVLALYHQTDLSQLTLRYLRGFPSLQMVVAEGCPGLVSASAVNPDVDGWEVVLQPERAETLYEYYQSSVRDEAKESSVLADAPILDFQVGQNTGRALGERLKKPRLVCLRRAKAYEREPALKRARVAASARPQGGKRAVMKERSAKDLGGILQEFL
ncbi:hypothetical protein BO78DRAFT_158090 [Aspergillus sclerotiicarbonarius CBS 121057]|uniref:Uncharacterized protein n=1 Tax=Aspergillus sclerotiicarbonarius (strain CBS 121057 / IBT 28362) TaxID=1448318 RepID=A0A319FE90_ASPSB|nr:hypothetical protein BO78DRAFT_158090 [Aspergillus sclerotiicarbonarius CBS 121057]